jgi:hypothetical protein
LILVCSVNLSTQCAEWVAERRDWVHSLIIFVYLLSRAQDDAAADEGERAPQQLDGSEEEEDCHHQPLLLCYRLLSFFKVFSLGFVVLLIADSFLSFLSPLSFLWSSSCVCMFFLFFFSPLSSLLVLGLRSHSFSVGTVAPPALEEYSTDWVCAFVVFFYNKTLLIWNSCKVKRIYRSLVAVGLLDLKSLLC